MTRDPLPPTATGRSIWEGQAGPSIPPEKFNDIVATAADLAIVLDRGGRIQSVVTNPLNPTVGQLDHWQNRDIRDVTARDSVGKLETHLEAIHSDPGRDLSAIELNHFESGQAAFPIRYTMHQLDANGGVLMLGRDLRPIAELQNRLVKAQLALERDYESQRDYETRYRRVLEAARDPFVLLDVNSGRVLDVNSAAANVLGAEPDDLRGSAFTQEFEGRRRSEFIDALLDAANTDLAPPVIARTRRGEHSVALTPILFRAGGDRMVLTRIEPEGAGATIATELAAAMVGLFRAGADAIVLTDGEGSIETANDAFLSLCDAGALTEVKGRSLADYLSRGTVDLRVLIENAVRNGKMRTYSTRLESVAGGQISIEVSATFLPGTTDKGGGFGFVLRDVSRMEVVREPTPQSVVMPGGTVSDDAMRNVMDLVGSAPLKDIVAATTDVVEKMCIETAVELTDNNRVAAAEMLGLSRQSLYVKLRKYGLVRRSDT